MQLNKGARHTSEWEREGGFSYILGKMGGLCWILDLKKRLWSVKWGVEENPLHSHPRMDGGRYRRGEWGEIGWVGRGEGE